MNLPAILTSKYALYAGAAVAVLGGSYALGFFSPAQADTGESDPSSAWSPAGLLPVTMSPQSVPAVTGSAQGDGSLDALIGLENYKTASNEKISLAEIDATYKTTMASTGAALQATLDSNKSLNLMSMASIFTDVSGLLQGHGVGAVAGNFSFGGETFAFDAARFYPGAGTFDAGTLKSLTAYRGIPNDPSPSLGNAVSLPYSGASSAGSNGRTSNAISPISNSLAVGQPSVLSAVASPNSTGFVSTPSRRQKPRADVSILPLT